MYIPLDQAILFIIVGYGEYNILLSMNILMCMEVKNTWYSQWELLKFAT